MTALGIAMHNALTVTQILVITVVLTLTFQNLSNSAVVNSVPVLKISRITFRLTPFTDRHK